MTEKLLRESLIEAQKRKQVGLIIWSDQAECDKHLANSENLFREGQVDIVETALGNYSSMANLVVCAAMGFGMDDKPSCMSAPVKRLVEDEDFFKKVLDHCKRYWYDGPITFAPSNEFVKSC